jgi:hypothetical protein
MRSVARNEKIPPQPLWRRPVTKEAAGGIVIILSDQTGMSREITAPPSVAAPTEAPGMRRDGTPSARSGEETVPLI